MSGSLFRKGSVRAAWWVSSAIGLCLLTLASVSLTQTKTKTQSEAANPDWAQVDRLVSEQKFQEAAEMAEKLRLAAQEAGNQEEWTRALIKEVQLRTGLHGYETAVRFLKEQPWPDGFLNRTALNLFYARSLVNYYRSYSWEINQREKVESRAAVDLKAWTRDQIYAEAQRAYEEVWIQRATLGEEPVSRFGEFLDRGSYPEGIRSTLRDTISYLYVDLLADTSLWTPQESNEIYRLDLKTLLAPAQKEVPLTDPLVHPLTKACFILADLQDWHARNRRRQAALEARLERLERLHSSFAESKDRETILSDLEKLLSEYRDVPWWAMGKAVQAEFIRDGGQYHKLALARAIAEEGWTAYPETIGGRRCYSIIKSIEAPDFSVASMASDGLQKRSIEITHKNLATLYFRAYPLDLEKRLETARDYNLLPSSQEQDVMLYTQTAAAEWSISLPPTPDFEMHRTFVTPPLKNAGCYTIVASAKKDFSKSEGNRITAVMLTVGNLTVLSSRETTGTLEVRTFSGESGRTLSGVTVSLYKYDWQTHHQKVDEQVSDEEGVARFPYATGRENAPHFLFARKGSDIACVSNYLYLGRPEEAREITASLVYTDRSVYRPLQKIFWKVLAYKGRPDKARFNTIPSTPVTVSLVDPNGQKVDERAASTNGFGSAAGEFTVPAGRLLGNWSIQSSLSGAAHVKVEEYKRPTFEVTIKDSESPLRLNKSAILSGEVRYYFGLPVPNGTVKWRATREPVYPWWWGWYGWRGAASVEIVASGTEALKEDGTFKITFTPEADERNAEGSKEISYRYRLSADVTDEGGETRSASKIFRLGFVSVEANIASGTGFFTEEEPGSFEIARTDLNGAPRPGNGSWRLVSLRQPETTFLPADLPQAGRRRNESAGIEYHTPGDALRPRWNPEYSYESVMHGWPDGDEQGRGNLVHDEKGEAKLALPSLPAGAYRIYYDTVDDFGASYQTSREFVVAGQKTRLSLPVVLIAENSAVPAGGKARFLALSGLTDQPLFFEIWRDGRLSERRKLISGRADTLIEIPVGDEDRGGFGVRLLALRDYQVMSLASTVSVPFDNKELKLEFSTFRDKLQPGSKETWRVTVKNPDGTGAEAGAAEVLAYMYDKSLDIFAPHYPPGALMLYYRRTDAAYIQSNLGQASTQFIFNRLFNIPDYPMLVADRLKFYDNYGIGGPGGRGGGMGGGIAVGVSGGVLGRLEQHAKLQAAPAAPPPASAAVAVNGAAYGEMKAVDGMEKKDGVAGDQAESAAESAIPIRSDFAETAFWRPQLLTGADGSASIEFTVPDSVTSWNVWVHAVTRDLKGGSLHKEACSVKDLMVRPYLPRFLREGDKAALKVVVNNASDREFKGKVTFDILDPATNESLLKSFGFQHAAASQPFTVAAGKGVNLSFPVATPARVGLVAFKVTAAAEDISDGELRPLPILPGRMHLAQSRFVTLKNQDRREMTFEDLRKNDDPTRVNEQMVVTLDAQLFYSVLSALPYLVNYPYECTEQTLNRFVSTGILSSLYRNYPAVEKMAQEFSKRDTRLETWDSSDPNRKMALEETPWLTEAKGDKDAGYGMTNVLDPRSAAAERESALAKLRKAQTAIGAFPWWPGGPPSPYMTLYIMYGFAKAAEFGVDVPKDMVQRGWAYLAQHFREEYAKRMREEDCCWEFLTFLNYTASCYPDASWMGKALTAQERKDILNFTFKHWKEHSPYLKSQLALTLKRMGRPQDASLVFASVMDSARSTQDEGTFWAPEDRSWLWYNDTIETHAFALRTLMELEPGNARKDGLVQWLFLNKKLNHWKSTRATAEVIYSLVHYLEVEGTVAAREDATVRVGGQTVQYVFEPDKYTGKKNQTVVPGDKVDAKSATVIVEKESPGFVFASATWQFSTEKLPEEGSADFLSVSREYFKRENTGREFVLKPLAEGTVLQAGDEIEIHLSIRSKHPCEYVQLRDPRAAGFEPENAVSRFRWDMGVGWYEEVRDSGTNFFFEQLPQGEYTFKYRLRANMAGTFKVAPATLQSMYAPEFNAYSAGATLTVK